MQAVAHTFPQDFTQEKQREIFREITLIYDLIDNVLATIERTPNSTRTVELEITNPFITQALNSANILSGLYTAIIVKGEPVTAEVKEAIESAFRTFYLALKDVIDGLQMHLAPKESKV
jgi:uncharacterized protein YjgD (DUF1641 family)